MRGLLSAGFFLVFFSCLIGQSDRLTIPFTSSYIHLDGKSDDWDNLPIIIPGGGKAPYQNTNKAAMVWNEDNLFVIFYIKDHQLCYHETGDQNARLYLNDGVEIYIDTQEDSDAVMDKNDYQFLISIPESSVVFRGDKFLLNQGHQVPKDSENHTAIFQKKVVCKGTLNSLNDADAGYIAEIAIPWFTLGLTPHSGLKLKIDLCVNDIDTLVDMAAMPDDWHPASMNYINLSGSADYGFPQTWTVATLTGGTGYFYTIKKSIDRHWQYFYVAIVFIIGVGIWIIYKQLLKIRFYQNFPSREQLVGTQIVKNELIPNDQPNEENTKVSTEVPESIQRLQSFIESRLEKNINLDEMSLHIHVSNRQLQRLTKEHCGMSPMQWVNVRKMEEAANRLKQSTKTVSEIAYDLGYEDAAYFSQLFKKYHGTTPVGFRKSKSLP